MKRTKKVLLTLLSVLTVASFSVGLASCEWLGKPVDTPNLPPIQMPSIGNPSVDNSSSTTGGNSHPGTDDENGKDGQDGLTPYIGKNGNWWIGDTDTGVKATGTKGEKGENGADGKDGVGIKR